MAKDIFYSALDIGTSTISTIVARIGPEGELTIVGTGLSSLKVWLKGKLSTLQRLKKP